MTIGWRVLAGFAVAYPAVQGAVLLGLSLPVDRVNAALTAGSFGFLVAAAIVVWIAGAHKMLQVLASVFLPGVLLAALLLTLPR